MNNKGFSLVEMIIVVAIISVMLGVAGYGLSLSSGKQAQECAEKLTSALQHTRTVTMGKQAASVTVTSTGNGLVVTEQVTQVVGTNEDGTEQVAESSREWKFGSGRITVEFSTDYGANFSPLSSVQFAFDRGSGALDTSDAAYFPVFRMSSGSKTWYVIIAPLTGRVSAATQL